MVGVFHRWIHVVVICWFGVIEIVLCGGLGDRKSPPRLGGNIAGFGLEIVENPVAAAASGFKVGSLEGDAVAFLGFSGHGAEGEVAPPGAIVIPEVVIRVVFGSAGCEVVCHGHV